MPRNKPHTEETKRKIGLANSIALKGKKIPDRVKKKMSKAHKGHRCSKETKEKLRNKLKGRVLSKEWREKISKSHLGKKHTKKTIRKMSLSLGGTGVPVRSRKRYYHLRDRRYMEWRSKVFERDNWTCQTCGKRGCYLEPHHIKSWTKYPKLRYDVENGVSLCRECHRLTRKKY